MGRYPAVYRRQTAEGESADETVDAQDEADRSTRDIIAQGGSELPAEPVTLRLIKSTPFSWVNALKHVWRKAAHETYQIGGSCNDGCPAIRLRNSGAAPVSGYSSKQPRRRRRDESLLNRDL